MGSRRGVGEGLLLCDTAGVGLLLVVRSFPSCQITYVAQDFYLVLEVYSVSTALMTLELFQFSLSLFSSF